MPDYRRLARMESDSHPGTFYEVSTQLPAADPPVNPLAIGGRLSCNCPGWTRQTHAPGCAGLAGRTCSCRGADKAARTQRTCKHVREVAGRVVEAGGLRQALEMVQRGWDFGAGTAPGRHGDVVRPVRPRAMTAVEASRRLAPAARPFVNAAPNAPLARAAGGRAIRIRDEED